MNDVEQFINTLIHESRYDPVKAHEYYMRTRELEGRRSTSDLKTEKQKRGWAYVKNEVQEDKEEALEAASEKRKAEVAQLRANAEVRREQIREQFRSIMVERKQMHVELKASVDNAREVYRQAREAIKAKFEQELDREFESIRTRVR